MPDSEYLGEYALSESGQQVLTSLNQAASLLNFNVLTYSTFKLKTRKIYMPLTPNLKPRGIKDFIFEPI